MLSQEQYEQLRDSEERVETGKHKKKKNKKKGKGKEANETDFNSLLKDFERRLELQAKESESVSKIKPNLSKKWVSSLKSFKI